MEATRQLVKQLLTNEEAALLWYATEPSAEVIERFEMYPDVIVDVMAAHWPPAYADHIQVGRHTSGWLDIMDHMLCIYVERDTDSDGLNRARDGFVICTLGGKRIWWRLYNIEAPMFKVELPEETAEALAYAITG